MNKTNDPLLAEPGLELRPDDVILYAVYKQGRFGQGIHALHPDKDAACDLASKAAARDRDHYHSWDVYPVPVGRLPSQTTPDATMLDFGWMNLDPVFSIANEGKQPTRNIQRSK